ncbi:MAG TPA: diaminopimelate epimerase [Solirubrobacteraceae bacterium]
MSLTFEKWTALGNDYLIVEAEQLPWPLTSERVRRLCDPHLGIGSDGVLLLSRPDETGFVARLRIFNPDGSEAELSGNGAREAILYLRRRGWTDQEQFSIQTAAGEIRPTILDERTCRVDMGRASTRSAKDFPSGGDDGRGDVEGFAFQFVSIGNPQCAIAVEDPEVLDLHAVGPRIERSELFPNRTNVSFYAEAQPGVIRARIFERGVGETLSSGTGAIGAAVAYALSGGDGPVTVRLDGGELTVEIDDALHIDLTGWAVPIASGTLSQELEDDLAAL